MNYEEFSQEKIKKLIRTQDQFKENFQIDSFANWFYNSDSEILRLYNDDEDEIYFKYISIGTFSLKSETWMWNWFNNHSIEKSKEELLLIKELGIKNNFEKLKEGTFPSDEFDGWELMAICLDYFKGIGAYKVKIGDLYMYLLIMNQKDKNSLDVKKLKQQTIECKDHGYSIPAFVCQHLNLETPKGFEEAFDTYKGMELEEDDDFQAWCSECEKIRIKDDGWNEESEKFAQIKLICENCYFDLKSFNQ